MSDRAVKVPINWFLGILSVMIVSFFSFFITKITSLEYKVDTMNAMLSKHDKFIDMIEKGYEKSGSSIEWEKFFVSIYGDK
jgi:hypothetical protein